MVTYTKNPADPGNYVGKIPTKWLVEVQSSIVAEDIEPLTEPMIDPSAYSSSGHHWALIRTSLRSMPSILWLGVDPKTDRLSLNYS